MRRATSANVLFHVRADDFAQRRHHHDRLRVRALVERARDAREADRDAAIAATRRFARAISTARIAGNG